MLNNILELWRSTIALTRRGAHRAIFWTLGLLSFGEAGALESRGQMSPVGGSNSAVAAAAQQPALTLEQLLRQVEANHPKLRGAGVERRIADAKLLEKQGAFDPVIRVDSDYLRFNSNSLRGKLGTARQTEAGVEWLTRSGVKMFSGSRFNFGSVKSPLSATGDGGEYFTGVMLPLFRNRGINEKSAAEQQALIGLPLADAGFDAARIDLRLNAALSYWDWVAAKRRLDVNLRLLELARVRADQIRERVRGGDLPPIDQTEADQEVQRREGAAVKADRDLQKSSFKLTLYLWGDDGQPAAPPLPAQVPTNFRDPTFYADGQVRAGIESALVRRPELREITLTRDVTDIDVRLALNERKPAIDLYLAPGRDTGFASIGTTMKMGVTVELPLRRRRAEGQLAAAQLKMRKLDLDEQNERLRIAVEVRDAASAINTTSERYANAQREVSLARDLERGERAKFDLGDSTLFLVNQRERAAAEAEIKLIDIQAEHEQSVALFRAATVTQ